MKVYHRNPVWIFALLAIFFLFAVYGMLVRGAPPEVVAIALGLTSLLLVSLIVEVVARAKTSRILSRLEMLVAGYEDNTIRFTEPVTAQPVRVIAEGWWSSTGRSRHYSYVCNIVWRGEKKTSTVFHLEDRSYGIVVRGNGVGTVELPGLELEEPGLRGALVLLVPAQPPVFAEAQLEAVSPHGDLAIAVVEPGEGLRGSLSLTSKAKARGARLELEAWLGRGKLSRRICQVTSQGTVGFAERLAPEEPLVILTIRKRFSPLVLAKKLGAMMVGDRPTYTLRLVLDIPLARDIVALRQLETKSPKH